MLALVPSTMLIAGIQPWLVQRPFDESIALSPIWVLFLSALWGTALAIVITNWDKRPSKYVEAEDDSSDDETDVDDGADVDDDSNGMPGRRLVH